MDRSLAIRALVTGGIALLAAGPIACSSEQRAIETAESAPPAPRPIPEAREPRDHAVLVVEDYGEIRFELLPELAPKTVENFVTLAEKDFYDGTTFHRVIEDFMIQGGDPNTKDRDPRNDGRGGPGYTIDDEISGVAHLRGIVSMGKRSRPNTGGSQFFITVSPQPHLDRKHTVFGRVVDGMDVVDHLARVETDRYGRHGPKDRPLEDLVVTDVRIERDAGQARADEPDPAEESAEASEASEASEPAEEAAREPEPGSGDVAAAGAPTG